MAIDSRAPRSDRAVLDCNCDECDDEKAYGKSDGDVEKYFFNAAAGSENGTGVRSGQVAKTDTFVLDHNGCNQSN